MNKYHASLLVLLGSVVSIFLLFVVLLFLIKDAKFINQKNAFNMFKR